MNQNEIQVEIAKYLMANKSTIKRSLKTKNIKLIHHDKINRGNRSLKFIFETDHWDVLTTLLDRGTSFHIFVPPSAWWTHVSGDPPIAMASEVLALVLGIANRARRPRAGLHGFVAQASFERHKVEVKHLGIHLSRERLSM